MISVIIMVMAPVIMSVIAVIMLVNHNGRIGKVESGNCKLGTEQDVAEEQSLRKESAPSKANLAIGMTGGLAGSASWALLIAQNTNDLLTVFIVVATTALLLLILLAWIYTLNYVPSQLLLAGLAGLMLFVLGIIGLSLVYFRSHLWATLPTNDYHTIVAINISMIIFGCCINLGRLWI